MDNSSSQTRALGVSLLFTQDTRVQLILCSEMLNQLDYEGVTIPMGPNGPHSKLIYLVGIDYEGRISSRFTFVHKGILFI